jgi:cytoskeletal protein RodZ
MSNKKRRLYQHNNGWLTHGEGLALERRQEGLSQGKAAKRLGVSRSRYQRWELDLEAPEFPTHRYHFKRLEPHDQCWLLRRRAQLSLEQVAAKLEYSRYWVTQLLDYLKTL